MSSSGLIRRTLAHRPWVAIFLVALSLRLLYLAGWLPLLETRQTPVYGDADYFFTSGVTWARGHPTLGMMPIRGPGYTLFLASVFRLFGEDPWPVRYVQAVLDSLTCVFIYLLGREIVSRRIGTIAGLLAAAYPTSILFTGRILSETVSLFLFWSGVLLLVRALRVRAPAPMAIAGLSIAAASLTRPFLLATVPFVVLTTALCVRGATRRQRALRVAVFAAALLGPLAGWNVAVRMQRETPVAGSAGLRLVVADALRATLSQHRGWQTDDVSQQMVLGRADLDRLRKSSSRDGAVEETPNRLLPADPLYFVPAAANLFFYHLWFLDNLWREVPMWLHGLQRTLVVLALGGLGMALIRGVVFAPLLLLCVPFALVSVKWIQVRHNLPFMPVVFLLASLCLSGLVDLLGAGPRRARHALLLLGASGVTGIVLLAARPLRLALLLPTVDPVTLGALADALVAALGGVWGVVLFGLARESVGRLRALVVGLLPGLTFSFLFGSYAYVGSEPRWRSWQLDLATLGRPVVQEIQLRHALLVERIEAVLWLVDLQTSVDPPPLRVGTGGTWLSATQYSWQRLFCNDDNALVRAAGSSGVCSVYDAGIGRFTGAFTTSPQWWGIHMDARLLGEGDRVSLALAGPEDPAALDGGDRISLGGSFSRGTPGSYFGPDVNALTSGPHTSLYRWHVANDWRMWGTFGLASQQSLSRIGPDEPDRGPADDEDGRLRGLAAMMARHQAQLNVRLLIEYDDGQVFAF